MQSEGVVVVSLLLLLLLPWFCEVIVEWAIPVLFSVFALLFT